ncbi:MAG: nucleoside triphosphate pyrophosphatase [Planctomycetota bacterium]
MRILLASTSPRRLEILREAGIEFRCVPPGAELSGFGSPTERAIQRAEMKATGARFLAESDGIVLGVDTVVARGDREYGKASDQPDARAVLSSLAGGEHEVITAHFAFRAAEVSRAALRLRRAVVRMDPLDEARLEAYLASGDWIGKAGAYGIQDPGASFVHLVSGERDTVIGMSLGAVRELIEELR